MPESFRGNPSYEMDLRVYVTFTVSGIVSGEDTILAGPATGTALDVAQMTLNGALTGSAVTAVVVNGSIPSDTPATGTIRIQRANGAYTKHSYSAWSGSTFTTPSTDFSSNNRTLRLLAGIWG